MQSQESGNLGADLLLLLVALIWGFGFVAQRAGMDHVGPFTYNAVRFFLGALCLVPLVIREKKKHEHSAKMSISPGIAGMAAGAVLFCGASLQQVGIQFTTAGKSGFITGLYVVLVPLFALVSGRRISKNSWIGVFLSIVGLYFLTEQESLYLKSGDFLVLLGSVFWALHVLILGYLSPRTRPLRLARDQFFFCALLSLIIALFIEDISIHAIRLAAIPILFGGLVSVGIGYTLQVVAQQKANPTHAAIILSLEAVFAALGGWLLLNELLSIPMATGCSLMLAGMVCSQIGLKKENRMK